MISVTRTSTKTVNIIFRGDLTGAKAILVVKRRQDLDDSNDDDALVRKEVTSHNVQSSQLSTTTFELSTSDTNLAKGVYYYTVKFILADNSIYQTAIDKFVVRQTAAVEN